jgi:hypothetical protein
MDFTLGRTTALSSSMPLDEIVQILAGVSNTSPKLRHDRTFIVSTPLA